MHCAAFAFGDGPVFVWTPHDSERNEAYELDIFAHVAAGGTVVAHNAAFEWAIWNYVCVPKYGWPPLRIEQMRCTMAQAYAMALPGALEKVAPALGVEQRKDMAGARVMMQLAKPRGFATKHPSAPGEVPIFWTPADAPEKFEQLYSYCKTDVVVEREADRRMMRLSPAEQRLWVLDQVINQRGIQVDRESIDAAIALVESEKARLNAEMLRATGGVVGSCTEVQLLVKWIRTQGVEIKGLAKADVLDALKVEDMPPAVRRALLLRQEAAKSSTAKLAAMKQRASADGRVRGTKQYHGASTGRWAGRGAQTDNYPRPRPGIAPEHVIDMIDHLHDRAYLDMMYGPVMDALTDMLRGMITAGPGRELVASDFSAIEARVLAWLAGEEKVLDIFRTHGKIYEHAASGIYHVPLEAVTKAQRQIGKVAVLALGYGGGVGAFQSMARVYGVKVADEEAEAIKVAWRAEHKKITYYWHDLESAAVNAMAFDCVCKAGAAGRQVAFKRNGSFLWCRLPSGRVLCYPYPRMDSSHTFIHVETGQRRVLSGTALAQAGAPGEKWRRERSSDRVLWFWTVNGTTNKWEETSTYGGSLSENVTQAVARDLLSEAIVRVEAAGYPVVMHVHDEIVVEVPAGVPSVAKIETLMCALPAWATGLPIAAEGWQARRYRK